MTLALELDDISRRFGNVLALRHARLQVRSGTVHAVLGENGAGKTTLMRVAFGMLTPDSGRVLRHGMEVRIKTPADALRLGVGMVHQHFTLVPAMTVAENIALGMPGKFSVGNARARVVELSRQTGLSVPADALVESLPVGAQQRVEILKAVARDAELLVLDEPTAVLAPREVDDLLAWIRRFATGTRAVVLITHKLREALAVADDVTVLRAGETVLTRPASSTSQTELVAAMLGEADSSSGPSVMAARPPGDVVFHLRDVTVRSTTGSGLRRASMEARAGEVLGVAAVEGSGQSELLRVLAGRLPVTSGRITRPDTCAFIPDDRHRDAAVLDFTLAENVALRGLADVTGLLDWPSVHDRTISLLSRFDVRAPGATTSLRSLSGGNQQKLILARELDPLPSAVVAENPTRGLDVNATREVLKRLSDAAAAGSCVVVYSSDIDEVLSLATRVIVLHNGQVIEVPNARDVIGRAMLGVTP